MNRASVLVLLGACGTAPGGGSTDTGESTTSTTTMGGATWQDVPTSSDASTSTGSTTTDVGSTSGIAESSSGAATTGESSGGSESSGGVDPTRGGSESGAVACEEMACGDCAACAVALGGPCVDLGVECEKYKSCPNVLACFVQCGVTGLCLDDCCDGAPPFAALAAQAANDCIADACSTACGDYNEGLCN